LAIFKSYGGEVMDMKLGQIAIYYNEGTKEFHIQGLNFSYIFKILKNNQLGHIFYGKRIHHRASFSHLLKMKTRGNSTVQFEDDPAFSLEMIKQEYPSYGTTDFREPAFQIVYENGSRISNFEYKEHKIYKGKPRLDGLPATYVENENEAITLEIHLFDELTATEIILLYTVFAHFNVLTRSAKFINKGKQTLNVTRAMSASIDFFDADFEMIHLSGAWTRERHVKNRKLEVGIQSVSSTRGNASSPHHNPFIALKRPEVTEHQGEVYGFSLVYSGNFLAQVEVDNFEVARVSLGINPFDFNWRLERGESFQTPEAVMVYSDQGLNGMSQTYHEIYRTRLVRGEWRDKVRPVLINNWEATYFSFNEEKLLEIAKVAKDLGAELFVLDDGWFGQRNNSKTSLGDWFVNHEKIPNGIDGLSRKINDLGLAFGLWFEPEMISKQSKLYREHPDWLIQVPGRRQSPGRNQFVLDFSRKEVVDHIYALMAQLLSTASISYIKWDMNRYMTEIGSMTLPTERQKELSHRYILGVYRLYERLTNEFPHVLFESCAAGGGRFDPGMLYYAPQTWTSDDTDAVERLKIQYGTSLVYPLSSMGAHVSAIPNHQVRRLTNLHMRAAVAYFGVFGYELDVTTMSEYDRACMREQINFYKEHRELIQKGLFYRLLSPFVGSGNDTAWMVVSKDKKEAILGYYQVLAKPNAKYKRLLLKGLEPNTEYEIEGSSITHYGDELMNFGLVLEEGNVVVDQSGYKQYGDFTAQLFVIKAKR
jgi:alpha-galactosidase